MKRTMPKRLAPLLGLLAAVVVGSIVGALLSFGFFSKAPHIEAPTLTNDNASALIGCRLSLHSASGVTNELGRAEQFKPGPNGPDVYVDFGWFDSLGQRLKKQADDQIAPAWVPATVITGYTCNGGKSWTRFSK